MPTVAISTAPYDPNSETDPREQQAALHWELIRRNAAFRAVAARWLAAPAFRRQHSATEDYHHQNNHFARCALDWMLDPTTRTELAHHQIAAGRWFVDSRFNFGPIVITPKVNWLTLRPDQTIRPPAASTCSLTRMRGRRFA